MGNTAENVAEKYQITREKQDEFAVASQRKAGEAMAAGDFKDEFVPVTIKTRKGEIVIDTDEHPKPDTQLEVLAGLRPAFQKDGTVTAGNASGINDGAAAIVLMSATAPRNAAWSRSRGSSPGRRSALIPRSWVQGQSRRRRKRWNSPLEHGRSRPDRSQRGFRGTGVRGEQGPRLGHREGQHSRRRDRTWPSDRCVRRTRTHDIALRHAET